MIYSRNFCYEENIIISYPVCSIDVLRDSKFITACCLLQIHAYIDECMVGTMHVISARGRVSFILCGHPNTVICVQRTFHVTRAVIKF